MFPNLTPEQQSLKKRVHDFAEIYKPFASEWDKKQNVPIQEMMKRAKEYGLMGLTLPKEYGGQDLTALEYALVCQEAFIASESPMPPQIFFCTTGPGPTMCMRSDNEKARRKFLPMLVKGETICSINLSEYKHGSALTDLETTAVPDGDDYIINGIKPYGGFAGAKECNLHATMVRFNNIPGSAGVGAIMIERGSPGLRYGKNTFFTGLKDYPRYDVILENCRVPKENVLFREGQFSKLMSCFNMERLTNSALSVATAQAAFNVALKYIQERKQFGKHIIEFQAVQGTLAEMYMQIEAAQLLVYKAAMTAENGKYPRVLDITTAKVFANQVAVKVTEEACWLCGANGVNEDLPLERYHRLAMIGPLGGGTHNILRTQIAAQLTGRKFSQRE